MFVTCHKSWVFFSVELIKNLILKCFYFLIKMTFTAFYVFRCSLGSHGCYIFCTESQDISASVRACCSLKFSSATEHEKANINRLIDPLGHLSKQKRGENPISGSILPDLWSKGIYGFLLHYLNSVKVLFLKRKKKKKSTGSYCVVLQAVSVKLI